MVTLRDFIPQGLSSCVWCLRCGLRVLLTFRPSLFQNPLWKAAFSLLSLHELTVYACICFRSFIVSPWSKYIPATHYLDYWAFVLSFGIRYCQLWLLTKSSALFCLLAFLQTDQNQTADFKRRKVSHQLFFLMEVDFHLYITLWTIGKSTILNHLVHSLESPFVYILVYFVLLTYMLNFSA